MQVVPEVVSLSAFLRLRSSGVLHAIVFSLVVRISICSALGLGVERGSAEIRAYYICC